MFNFPHSEGQILVDIMPIRIKIKKLYIAHRTLPKDHHV
jgi:hypothetical protein